MSSKSDLRRSQFTLTPLDAGRVASEAAVLVGVLLPGRSATARRWKNWTGWPPPPAPASSASSSQRREAPDAATYLGKGKVEELTSLAAATDADVVIFDNDLSPGANPQPGARSSA